MAEKLTGDDLNEAVEQANAEGANIDPFARADDKRAALQEFYAQNENDPKETSMTEPASNKPESAEAEQPEASQVDDEVQENDPVADRVAKHGETPEEELEAQRDAVTGTVAGQDRGPSQDDLNPAYATEKIYDPEAKPDEETEGQSE